MIHAAGVFAFPQYTAQYRSMGSAGYAVIHRYEDVYQASTSVTKILSYGGPSILPA